MSARSWGLRVKHQPFSVVATRAGALWVAYEVDEIAYDFRLCQLR